MFHISIWGSLELYFNLGELGALFGGNKPTTTTTTTPWGRDWNHGDGVE